MYGNDGLFLPLPIHTYCILNGCGWVLISDSSSYHAGLIFLKNRI